MKEKLQDVLGLEAVSDIESDRLIYSTDASNIKGKVKFVVWPKNEEQIRRILTLSNRKDVPITIRGGGTSLVAGAVPNNSIVLSTTKMNKILRLNIKEKTLEVEAGTNIERINKILKRFNLFFPITPFSNNVCTIGGMLATNAKCPNTYSMGNISGWIEELRYMDGTGKLFKIANKEKIIELIGTEGTLCIFTHVKLKLTARKALTTEVLVLKTTTGLIDTLANITSNYPAVSVEFIDPLVSVMGGLEEAYYLILTYFSDKVSTTKIRKNKFLSLFGNSTKTNNQLEIKHVRSKAHHITNKRQYTIIEDVTISLENMRDFLRWLRKRSIPCFGHIASGRLHIKFKKDQSFLIEEMYDKLSKLGGKPYGELGIGRLKPSFLDDDSHQDFLELKQKYDHNNILNRGVSCVHR